MYVETITTSLSGLVGLKKMIDLFKKVIGYTIGEKFTVLFYILKYISGIQEACNKEACTLWYVPCQFWKYEMSIKALGKVLNPMRDNPDHLKTQEMCNEAVRREPYTLECVPDHLKTREMCNKAVEEDPYRLKFVPDSLKTQKLCDYAV